jgi:hypothetical protein
VAPRIGCQRILESDKMSEASEACSKDKPSPWVPCHVLGDYICVSLPHNPITMELVDGVSRACRMHIPPHKSKCFRYHATLAICFQYPAHVFIAISSVSHECNQACTLEFGVPSGPQLKIYSDLTLILVLVPSLESSSYQQNAGVARPLNPK